MPLPFRLLFALLPFLLSAFNTGAGDNGDGEEGDDDGEEGNEEGTKSKIEWTPEQQKELNRIAAKAEREGKKKGKTEAETLLQQQRDQEAADQKVKDDEAKGNYEDAKKALEGERDTAVSERDTLKAENEVLTTYFQTQYEAALKDLPEVIKEFAPDADASFATKSTWLTKALEQAKKFTKQSPKGPGFNPPPAGEGEQKLPRLLNSRGI